MNSLYKASPTLVFHNNARLLSEQQTFIMAVTNWIQFGILCALLTGGYGNNCSTTCEKPLHTLDNVACHKEVVAVIKIKVKSEAIKDKNLEYHEVEVLKSYKCDNNSKPVICMSPLPKIAKVQKHPTSSCPGLKLENRKSYLFTAYNGWLWMDANLPNVFYNGCNVVKRWSEVDCRTEQKIIDQAAKCPNRQE